MSIIGQILDPRRGEPQALFDAIREELFSDLPDPDVEVDVAVVYKSIETIDFPGQGEMPILEVIDYEITRIGDEYLLDADPHVGSNEYVMAVDEWARNVEGMDSYMWVHRHPDGYVQASPKDHRMMSTFVTIDFARGDKVHRQFVGGAIIDSYTSIPLHAGEYWPPLYIGNGEIDVPVAFGLLDIAKAQFPDDPDHFIVRAAQWTTDHIHELVDLKINDPDNETERSQELQAELKALLDEGMKHLIDEFDFDPNSLPDDPHSVPRSALMLGLDGQGNVTESDLGDMPPAIREIFERLVADIEKAELGGSLVVERNGEPIIGAAFDPPTTPQPKSIFDLPKLGEEDDPKINWN